MKILTFLSSFLGVIATTKPGVDDEVFIAIKVGENVGTLSLIDNQTFRRVQINDVQIKIVFTDSLLNVLHEG